MLPSLVAEDLRASLTSFLGTTFALADDEVRAELERFIANPHDGVFRGPYVRLRTPFRHADDAWRQFLDWSPAGFHPHKHQAEAWMRLSSKGQLPKPTLVTTGTGSGKTESFLIPLLEHCRRERQKGRGGIKALVLYPMNALANDQARRIAKLVHGHREELGDVSVGLYTGDSGTGTVMTETAVIEDKHHMRKSPPDVMLTNYKMLDMLLLRSEDQPLFAESAESLRYLVLDEFHTYDGAQGTDVAMLLRRLGMSLGVSTDQQPLGAITPVATSATLGGGAEGGPALREFARTVFGTEFDESSLVGEDRLTVDEWVTSPATGSVPLLDRVTKALTDASFHEDQVREGIRLFLLDTEDRNDPRIDELLDDAEALGRALASHPFTRTLVTLCTLPVALTTLATDAEPSWGAGTPQRQAAARHAIALYLALLSRARSKGGRPLLTVDVQLWLREVSRLLRQLSRSPRFHWFEGAPPEDGERSLPSIFCRHCGRSGWGVVATPGGGNATSPNAVWRRSASDHSTQRAWIFAPGEAQQESPLVRWVDPDNADFVSGPSGKHSNEVPVLVTPDAEAAKEQRCPACGHDDAIRFLGSRVATLASATLGQLFGSPDVAPTEKKTLVFTDSVQDASHRATFVENRAYALNLRALLHRAIGPAGTTLDALGAAVEAAAANPAERFAMLPPDLRLHETFAQYWTEEPSARVRQAVATRMTFAATLEFGLAPLSARTLERTGAATAEVVVPDLDAVVKSALDSVARQNVQLSLDGRAPEATRAWARGLFERMRSRGAIAHRWFRKYAETDDRYPIWGGRPYREGMPAFPGKSKDRPGRPAPAYPTSARTSKNLDIVLGPRSWYTTWTTKVLKVPTVDAHKYVLALLKALTANQVLTSLTGVAGSTVWQIPPERVRVERTDGVPDRLRCSVCSTILPGPPAVLTELNNAPCMQDQCPGSYRREHADPDYYRDLYRGEEVRRIIAREHTSLLKAKERVELENTFKAGSTPDAPNVLTCTPTLELGIDIGDLSTVALTSLPRSTASYLQRVGRAGRLTGNALVVSLLPARPLELQRLAQPLSMIAGEVVPPACYLDATEILRRQYLASLVDRRARSGHPTTRLAKQVFRDGLAPSSWLGSLVADARAHAATYVDEFLRGFGDEVSKDSAQALREWAGDGSPDGEPPEMERAVEAAVKAWIAEGEELAGRVALLKAEIEAMKARPSLDDAGKRELRRLNGEIAVARATGRERDRMYWISALEAKGLLPNYALLDDTTRLDVGLWWTDEETGASQTSEEQYVRGSRTALGELAPGAVFYVRGTAVQIDGLDLGTSRNPATIRRRFCPACGWSRPLDGSPAGSCPRCGAVTAADAGQVLTTLPFRGASAYTSRESAMREDDGEDRRKTRFEIVTTVDAEPDAIAAAWQLTDYPFGVEVLRTADIRWVNLGPAERGGSTLHVAGNEVTAPLFHACRHCGVVPAAQRVDAARARHRGWCRQRKEPDDQGWVTVALTHDLRTQAVRLLVPPIVVADAIVRTSFRAALLLGLRQVLGGEPEHLDVVEAADPVPGSGERWVMVLHDLVPGGTGYLGRFAEPDQVYELLAAALQVLQACECRTEGLAACHRCLLPHVPPHMATEARRESAISLITEIFQQWSPEPIETLKDIVVGPHDTPIERRFRQLLVRWAKSRSAAVTLTATGVGDAAEIRFPQSLGGQVWRATPQVPLGGVQPDFVLECGDRAVPKIAVFCDGQKFHSSSDHNRVADDAEKRADLRAKGYLVWAVTHQDLDAFTDVLDGIAPEPAGWIDARYWQGAVGTFEKQPPPGSVHIRELFVDPLSLLVAFVLRPSPSAWKPAAHALALTYALGEQGLTKTVPEAVPELMEAAITGTGANPAPGKLGVLTKYTVHGAALVLERRSKIDIRAWLGVDDRDDVVGSDGQVVAWRDWLALGNVLQFLEPGRFQAHSLSTVESAPASAAETVAVSPAWQDIADTFEGSQKEQVLHLAVGHLPPPEPGYEVDDGELAVDLAWPDHRVAVLLEEDEDVRRWLLDNSWTVVTPDVAAVATALSAGGSA
ncbi:DEAD/DEAH box helicase [Pseudonocardia sp. RS11V-5]|uniref:DEAD/DEAH box helicase n=1 Tax=Pseudonocardia terrae TaxID=2905831 RepID=UPI001E4910C6|nr:DEAD/DEAH box helicase [Pseudonocardia terrae]MCE3554508.1 DEAD/DEAH box helicase [Pseudonocardia terrae]